MTTGLEKFRAMGCEVVVCAEGDRERVREVRALFEERDARFSRFVADSELVRVNAAAASHLFVSDKFARAVRAALWAARATDGLVDPTLLEALEHAGYEDDFDALAAHDPRPAGAAVPGRADAVAISGRLLARPRGVKLDLAGVVKAMAVDDAVGLLGAGWVSAGGDLATTRPVDVALAGGGAVRLENGGLATSGSGTRRWQRAGVAQHHLIDPRTGMPAESPWETVTVSGASCVHADVAAKAAFLLGDDGPEWLDERGMPGRFVRPDGSRVVNEVWRGAVAACI